MSANVEFAKRAKSRIAPVAAFLLKNHIRSVIVAGGALLREFKDLDLFPDMSDAESAKAFDAVVKEKKSHQTRNAASFVEGGVIVQLCKYRHATLEDLVRSFDFAHCQIGARLKIAEPTDGGTAPSVDVAEVFMTTDFQSAMLTQSTNFIGSKFPLSSMIRLFKVKDKMSMSRVETGGIVIRILAAICERGFGNWEDFKDQLDAIDLALGVKDLEGYEDDCKRLFEALRKDGGA